MIQLPFGAAADDGGAVIEDAEEILAADGIVFNAFHDERARRFSCGHVVEIGIDAHNGIVILNVIIGIIGV